MTRRHSPENHGQQNSVA